MIRNHLQKQPLFLDAVADLQHSSAVDAEFNSLDAKVAQFVGLCDRLRSENHDLRQQQQQVIFIKGLSIEFTADNQHQNQNTEIKQTM